MEGYIKLEVKREGNGQRINGDIHLEHVNLVDKVSLLDSFAEALDMDEAELVAAALTVPEFRKRCKSERVSFNPAIFGRSHDDDSTEDDSDGDDFSFDYGGDEPEDN